MIEEESFGIIPLRQTQSEWYVLLIRHQKGRHWGFPKGRGNPGETPLQSAIRELKEETNLDIEHLLQEHPLTEDYQFYLKKDIVHKKVSYFSAIVKGDLVLQEEEIQDAKWVLLKEAVGYLSFKESQAMCQTLLKNLYV